MDLQKFVNASLSMREATVDVPGLAAFFGKDKPVWTVRAVTAAELGRAKEAADSGHNNLRALADAAAGGGDVAESIRKVLGVSDKDTPSDVVLRIELLTAGSVSPALGQENREIAVKLSESYPTVFYTLTSKILSLTGQGSEVGKAKPSGKMEQSGQ